jgi:microcystin-dependent protein
MPLTSPNNISYPDNTSAKQTIEGHLEDMALSVQSAFTQTMPPGVIVQYVGAAAPSGFLLCQGQAVSRITYAELFAALGGASTPYGVGDGSTTFNVPNLQGRVPVGRDATQTEFDTLGETGGAKTHTLTEAQMPSHTHIQDSHNHTQNAHAHQFGYGGSNFNGWSAGTGFGSFINMLVGNSGVATQTTIASTTATNIATTATNQNTGGGGAHNNLQPYIVVNYIIKH